MKDWFTASELADMKLPELPSKRSSISKRASRKNWKSRPRKGRGGGNEFHISALPEAARTALMARHLSKWGTERRGPGPAERMTEQVMERQHQTQRERGLAEYRRMPQWAKDEADACLHILDALDVFQQHTSLTKGKAREAFARLYTDGQIDLGAQVREVKESVSAITLWRWRKRLREGGPSALANDRWRHESSSVIDQDDELRKAILGMVEEYGPDVYRTTIRKDLLATFDEERVPSLRTIQRYLQEWGEEYSSLASYLDAPKTWRGSHMTAFGNRDDEVTRPNQIWELDSTLADIVLETADGSLRRFALVGVIDVYTRRCLFLVTDASRASAIALVLRRAILVWGVPERVRMDQGKDYRSKHVDRFLTTMEIDVEFCTPFHPEQKPFVERIYKTLQHSDLETLPGYVGHNVAERQRIREREGTTFGDVPLQMGHLKMTPSEFQAWIDLWCTQEYEQRTHSTLGCSPREKAEQYTGMIRQPSDPRVLDTLLMPVPPTGGREAGVRTVRKKGISVEGTYYIGPEVGNFVGEDVVCYYDPHRLREPHRRNRLVVYRARDLHFIGLAVDPMNAGERQEIAKKARKAQRQQLREDKAQLRKASKDADSASAYKRILEARLQKQTDDLQLPHIAKDHRTDATDAASEAADALEAADAPRDEREVSEDELDEMKRLEAREAQRRQQEKRRQEEEQARLEREAAALEEASQVQRPQLWTNDAEKWTWLQDHPDQITEEDRAWIEAFEANLGVVDE